MFKLDIDIADLFKYSFNRYREYASFVVGVMITYFVFGILPQLYIDIHFLRAATTNNPILNIIALVVRLIITLGFSKIMLFLISDRQVEVNDLVNNWDIFFSYAGAWFLYYIAVVIGLFLFIIPGLYLAIRLQFYPYFVIDGDFAFDAIKKSWYATEGFLPELIVFGICFLLINLAGAVCFGIGMIFTYPLCSMAQAIIYEGLNEGADQLPTPKYLP